MGDYSVTLNSESNIIFAVHKGPWTSEDSYPFVDEIIKLASSSGVKKVLIDHRALQLDVSMVDLFYRGLDVVSSKTLILVSKVAMVYGTEINQNKDIYSFFETVLRNRGLNIIVFPGVLDKAIDWLTED